MVVQPRRAARTNARDATLIAPLELSRSYHEMVLLGLLIAVACVLLAIRLSAWPTSWFDEGLNLATASTLANEHTYGLPDSEGVRVMDPAIQTGPTVVVPVAVVFKVFGAELFNARLLMITYGMVALTGFLLAARRLSGPAGAIIAGVVLLVGTGDPFVSFVPLSRQVLGEVPALGFICFGMWVLSRHIDAPIRSTLFVGVTVGLLFGLAMVTKSQVALMLPAATGIFWLLNLVYYRAADRWLGLTVLVTSVLLVVVWYVIQLSIMGPEGYQENQEVLREGFAIHIAQLSTNGPVAALRALWSTGFLFWGLPGLAYGVVLARSRNREGLILALPLLFIGLWLLWYTILSIGWSRYAAMPLMLTPIFTARLFVDVAGGKVSKALPARFIRLVPLALLAGALGLGISFVKSDMWSLVQSTPNDHQSITVFLRQEIEADALIETWAWELDPFVPQHLRHPSTPVTNAYTRLVWDGEPVPAGTYDPTRGSPDYVLDNAFSAWTGIYSELIHENGELVADFGEYRLYAIR